MGTQWAGLGAGLDTPWAGIKNISLLLKGK